MSRGHTADLDDLIRDLKLLLELSFQDDEISLQKWLDEASKNSEGNCWDKNQCINRDCPAYKNERGRCWLIAGTMCGGETCGTFVEKYGSCTNCDVFVEAIGDDKVKELKELVISLIHSLRLKQVALKEALAEVKVLSGFLPICASCKNIRDDKGYWNKIEAYIRDHSEVEFSHGICPECVKKLYPEVKIKKR